LDALQSVVQQRTAELYADFYLKLEFGKWAEALVV